MSRPETSPRTARAQRSGDGPCEGLEPGRKAYRAPRLTVYGSLADLTRLGGSQMNDSGGGLGNLPSP